MISASFNNQKAKSLGQLREVAPPHTSKERVCLSQGDLISEESTLLSQKALRVQPLVLNKMNLSVSAQCFREGRIA